MPSAEHKEEFKCRQASTDDQPFSVCGYVSSCEHGSGRGSVDRQYYFINGRPCEIEKVSDGQTKVNWYTCTRFWWCSLRKHIWVWKDYPPNVNIDFTYLSVYLLYGKMVEFIWFKLNLFGNTWTVLFWFQVSRLLNEVYHSYNKHQYPCVFLNVKTDKGGWVYVYILAGRQWP